MGKENNSGPRWKILNFMFLNNHEETIQAHVNSYQVTISSHDLIMARSASYKKKKKWEKEAVC